MGVEDLVELHIAVVALQDLGLGLDGADDGLEMAELVLGDLRGFVEQDDVAELDLLNDECGEVVLAEVLFLQVVAQSELIAHAEGIDDGNDGVEACHAVAEHVLRQQLGIGGDGLCDGRWLADARGLDDDVVELTGVDDVVELLDEVGLERAADAAVLQGHERVVALSDDAALLNEVGVDVHLTDVVDDDGELDAFFVSQNAVE